MHTNHKFNHFFALVMQANNTYSVGNKLAHHNNIIKDGGECVP
jgi:hypothetical protein